MVNYHNVEDWSQKNQVSSYLSIYNINKYRNIQRLFWILLGVCLVILILPWTQNVRAPGVVTTLSPTERPQQVQANISGKIKKWYKQEGDMLRAGDTILILEEIKSEYLDPQLLDNTQEQLISKQMSAQGYDQKASSVGVQMRALLDAQSLKLKSYDNKIDQQMLKIKNDSAELVASQIALTAYNRQAEAALKLLENGAISQTEYEKRTLNYQNALAKQLIAQNKLSQSRQELSNLFIEKNATVQDYNEKIAKAQSEQFASMSSAASSRADVSKLQNQYNSYKIRNDMYIIRAPQDGQLTHAHKSGIGEIVKEGETVIEIVPIQGKRAVEIFIEPVDLPLIAPGQKVRFVFDGYPAIVFSGWPESSFGIFGGIVSVVENNVSANGKFRVLVAEDVQYKPWPKNLRMGNGAQSITLLNNVPVFYEIWRNINGFPPDFYKPNDTKKKSK